MIDIYKIEHVPSGRKYIGSSGFIQKRLNEHKRNLKNKRHPNSYLQRVYNKYPVSEFIFSPILECTEDLLTFYEDLIIKGYKTNLRRFGFNLREVTISNAGLRLGRTYKVGQVYNNIELLKPTRQQGSIPRYKKWLWLCKCYCGVLFETVPQKLKSGHTKSCGCYNIKVATEKLKILHKKQQIIAAQVLAQGIPQQQ